MSNASDHTTDVSSNQETNPSTENSRGDRGEVGQATASLTIKQMWHAATHLLADVGDKHNPRKQKWIKKAGTMSLKRFARSLLTGEHKKLVQDFFAHKRGSMNQKRSKDNEARIMLERVASKNARRKKAQKSAKTDATPSK